MIANLFDFWTDVPGDAREHSADKEVLARAPHFFEMECLPNHYAGPLRTAKVVFLFLSPGFNPTDVEDARSAEGQARYEAQRTGSSPLPGRIEDVVAELQARGVTQAERSAVARVLSALFRKGGREQAGDGFAGHAQA